LSCVLWETSDIAEQFIDAVDPPELQALTAELAYYQQASANRAAGIVADLQRQIEQFRYQQSALSATHLANRELLLRCFAARLSWKTLLDEEKQDIYRQLVDRVTMKDGQVVGVALKV
jgi:predicted RNA-binding Zn ribbon-like protein